MKTYSFKNLYLRVQAIILCIALVISFLPYQRVLALNSKDQTANNDIVRTMELSYKMIGDTAFTKLTSPFKISDITKVDSFHAVCSFNLTDHIDNTTGAVSRSVTAGDYYLINLPEKLIVSNPEDGRILGNND